MLLLQIDPWPAVDFLLLCSYHCPQMVGVLVRYAGFCYFFNIGLVLGDIANLKRRYDTYLKNITIQLYPQYCLYGGIQKKYFCILQRLS